MDWHDKAVFNKYLLINLLTQYNSIVKPNAWMWKKGNLFMFQVQVMVRIFVEALLCCRTLHIFLEVFCTFNI